MSRVFVPASTRGSVAARQRQRRSGAFQRAAAVLAFWLANEKDCRAAGEALARGQEVWEGDCRLTSPATLATEARRAAWEAAVWARVHLGATEGDARCVRAVFRAYIRDTPVSRRTLLPVLALGGQYAEIAMQVLARAR